MRSKQCIVSHFFWNFAHVFVDVKMGGGTYECIVQECSNSIANALEWLPSCTKPSKSYAHVSAFLWFGISRFIHPYPLALDPLFDLYAGPSVRGRQLYCRACNFKKQLLYLLCWAEWYTIVNGYWHNNISFKRYAVIRDPNQH